MAQSLQDFKKEQQKLSSKRLRTENYPKELTIVAEGDSWFDYPFRKDVLDYLIKKGYAIDKFAKAGDTLENMVYGTQYKKKGNSATHPGPLSLQETLNSIRKNKPKIVLFSAGGNDVVGSEILGYLNHKNSKPDDLLNKAIFTARLKEMEKAIEFFILAVRKTSKKSNTLMDGYEYPKINGKGYKFIFIKDIFGPWILPSMAMKGIVSKKSQEKIIKVLVDDFNEMLAKLDRKYSYFHHIDLRGKFPLESQWDNEIHLKNNGYKEVANIYHEKISSILNADPVITFKTNIIAK